MRRPRVKNVDLDEGWRKWAYSPIAVILLFIGVILIGNSAIGVFAKFSKSNELSQQAQAEVARLEAQRDALQEQVDQLSDTAGIESQLRADYNIVKEDEQMVQFIDETGE